jgi:hypothetical protein
MPKRTNPFQELVSLIQTALSREGDRVTDSAMVKVHGLETEREIDILHEMPGATFTVKVAVEAKDEGRPIDLENFDSYLGKYRGEGRVAADKVVLVSRHGFTAGVIEKAKLVDVQLLTLDEAKDYDWANLGPEHAGLTRQSALHVHFKPHICQVRLFPAIRGGARSPHAA